MGYKRSLVLEMEVRVSVYLVIIIIIRPDIAIDKLNVKQYSTNHKSYK